MRSIAGTLVGFALALVLASGARAHAEPVRAIPGDGAVLTERPTQIQLLMSQEMAREAGANDIDVVSAVSGEVTTVSAVIGGDRKTLTVPLPADLPKGNYIVRWKTLSAEDGDTAEGNLLFTYDPAGAANPGREQLKETLGGTATTTSPGTSGSQTVGLANDESAGTPWVLLAAVSVAMFALGGGTSYLLVQRRP